MADIDYSTEVWRDIPGYEGYYQASSFGRVRSVDRIVVVTQRRPGRIMKPVMTKGYERLEFNMGSGKNVTVHRAVCMAFHGLGDEGLFVCHNDGNPLNNRPENLRWGTPKENSADRDRHGNGQAGSRHWKAKLKEADVAVIRDYPRGYGDGKALQSKFGVSKATIDRIRAGIGWKTAKA